MKPFPCVKCGLCCRSLKNIRPLADFDRGDGVCRHLSGRLCSIYHERPEICNVNRMYHASFQDAMSEDAFIMVNLKGCLQLAGEKGDLSSYKKIEETINVYQKQGTVL